MGNLIDADGDVHGAECAWECALENSLAVS